MKTPSTSIGAYKCFNELTVPQYQILSRGWINEVSIEEVAQEAKVTLAVVTAWYLIKDISFYVENGYWPQELHSDIQRLKAM